MGFKIAHTWNFFVNQIFSCGHASQVQRQFIFGFHGGFGIASHILGNSNFYKAWTGRP